MHTSKKMSQMRRGLLELAVLTVIDAAIPPMRADEIMQKLSKTEFQASIGTLYSVYSDLRRNNFVTYTYDEQDFGTARRCYRITSKGKDQLKELRNYWYILDLTLKRLNSPR